MHCQTDNDVDSRRCEMGRAVDGAAAPQCLGRRRTTPGVASGSNVLWSRSVERGRES